MELCWGKRQGLTALPRDGGLQGGSMVDVPDRLGSIGKKEDPMRCPKCSYERLPTDEAPEGECPRCGIIYAKYRPPELSQRVVQSSQTESSRSPVGGGQRSVKVPAWVIPAVIALAAGYFAGREHVKYELRQTFQAAAEGMSKSIGAAFGTGAPVERKPTLSVKPQESAPLAATLLSKRFREDNYAAGVSDAITFDVDFNNLTGQEIRAFDGKVTFTDLLDNTILTAGVAINEVVPSGGSLRWSGEIDYNQFIDRHQRLRGEEFQNLKVVFEAKKILFTDGTVKQFE